MLFIVVVVVVMVVVVDVLVFIGVVSYVVVVDVGVDVVSLFPVVVVTVVSSSIICSSSRGSCSSCSGSRCRFGCMCFYRRIRSDILCLCFWLIPGGLSLSL